jgi:hypothetical protein
MRRRRSDPVLRVACGLAIALALAAGPAGAEEAWVRGELKLNFRASPNTTATPLGIVQTGDAVKVLERREGWARIEAAGGATGWLPESVLESVPPLGNRVAELEGEVSEARRALSAAQGELEALRARNAELEAAGSTREAELRGLEEENRVLRAGERWPYMLMGAAILGAGMLVGALLGGRSSRRMSSRIRI